MSARRNFPNGGASQDFRETVNAMSDPIVFGPDSGGNSGPMLNDRIAEMSARGGGKIVLLDGDYRTNETIVHKTRVSVSGGHFSRSRILPGPGFKDGDTLFSCRGTLSADPSTGSGNLREFTISDLYFGGSANTARLVDTSFVTLARFQRLQLMNTPETAWHAEQVWDSKSDDIHIRGAAKGSAVPALNIVASQNDNSNNWFWDGLWLEAIFGQAIHIGGYEGGTETFPDRTVTYNIVFDRIKAESAYVTDNTALIATTARTLGIKFNNPFIYLDSRDSSTVLGNVRMFDLDGAAHRIRGLDCGHGSKVAPISAVRLPRGRVGAIIDSVFAKGAGYTSIIETDRYIDPLAVPPQLVNYRDQSCVVRDVVREFATVPFLGGSGHGYVNVDMAQLSGLASPLAATGSRTIRRGELNRPIEFTGTGTSVALLSIDADNNTLESAGPGDKVRIIQKGSQQVSLVGFAGPPKVNILMPPGKTDTTSGAESSVGAEWIAPNTWRYL